MTSRERVRLALEHKEADRVPIDIGAMRSTGIAAIAYNHLTRALAIDEGPCRMYDFQQQLAYPGRAVRDRFRVDAIDAGQAFLESGADWREWPLNDGSRCLVPRYLDLEIDPEGNMFLKGDAGRVLGRKPKSSLYADQAFWPWRGLPGIPEPIAEEDLSRHMWAVPCPPFHIDWVHDEARFADFVRRIRRLHDTTDYAIMISIGHNLFEQGTFLRGIDNFLVDIYTDPRSVEHFVDVLVEGYMPKLERILDGVKDCVDIIQFGDDLGTSDGPWMAPEVLRRIFIPRYRKMWRYVHDHSGCKVFLHSCGSVYDLLPDLIEAGMDILNPVQTTAKNMEPQRLKREFGRDLTFWGGGCNTRDVLPLGTPQQVREDVRRRVEIFARDGGFVFNQIHNVLADVPPENVIAMYDAAFEFGRY